MKILPISYFEKEGPKALGAIWGINTADRSQLAVAGEVLLAIPKRNGNGQPDPLRIPQTWLPQELTRDIPRQRLLQSSEFRKAVSSQLIGLIDEATAHRILQQNGATEEQQRLAAQTKHIRTAGAARTIADSNATIQRADGLKEDDEEDQGGRNKTVVIDHGDDDRATVAELASHGVEDIEPGISPQFKMFVDKINRGSDIAAKNEIKGRRTFTRKEFSYMHRNLSRKFEATLAMITKNLEKKKK